MWLQRFLDGVVPYVVHSLEIMGIIIILCGGIRAFAKFVRKFGKHQQNPIKIEFAESVALALEFKLASEIIKTVTVRNMKELLILGVVITLRVILTFVTHWEITTGSNQNGKQNG